MERNLNLAHSLELRKVFFGLSLNSLNVLFKITFGFKCFMEIIDKMAMHCQ